MNVAENTTEVATVEATDADNTPVLLNELTFSISGGADAALFSIDDETGDLTFIAAPNYEDPIQAGEVDGEYEVEVSVSD